MDLYMQMNKRIEDAIKLINPKSKRRVCYSTYVYDDNDHPVDNLDKIAVAGKIRLVKKADEFWGGKKAKIYLSEILENPTWLQIAICANEMIETTRDTHHCFLEGIIRLIDQTEKSVALYTFSMGS